MDKNKISGYVAATLGGALLAFGICWYIMDYSRKSAIELGEKMTVADECIDILEKENYPLSDNDRIRAAIAGYIGAAADKNDPFTFYYEDSDSVTDMISYVNTAGTAIASGFQIGVSDDGNILITEVSKGKAADKQGLRQDDVITAIDGNLVAEAGFENIANKMLGKQDTEVDFTVRRDGTEFQLHFVRDHVYNNEAWFEKMGNVAYIRILQFDQMMLGQLNQSLEKSEEYSEIIIDLRDNPGGDGDVVVGVGADLSGSSKVVKHKYTGDDLVYSAENEAELKGKKTVVLINEYTASAAEILTAILKQNLDVTLVGVNTYGKGVYQEEAKLSNGGYLHYTAGTFTVGDWPCWQGIGIAPDVEVPMDRALIGTDDDIQLQKALELLN